MSQTDRHTALDTTRAKQQAREEFERWAETYDRSTLNRFLFRPAYLTLIEEIARWHHEHQRPFSVLDIGCGTGSLAAMAARADWPARIVGLDYSPAMAAQAGAKATQCGLDDRVRFVAADSEHLPFADASFDVLTCSNSFHHYPHQQEVIVEMRRVLRSGGRLVLIDGFRDNVIGWFVFDVIITRIEGEVFHAPWSTIRRYFDHAGLTNIRRRKFNFWFPSLATIADVP